MSHENKIIQFDHEKEMTEEQCCYYAQGMYDLYLMMGGETHCKSYDPVSFWKGEVHTYVFDPYNEFRHQNYINAQDVADRILLELTDMMIRGLGMKKSGVGSAEHYEKRVREAVQKRIDALSEDELKGLGEIPSQFVVRHFRIGGTDG